MDIEISMKPIKVKNLYFKQKNSNFINFRNQDMIDKIIAKKEQSLMSSKKIAAFSKNTGLC